MFKALVFLLASAEVRAQEDCPLHPKYAIHIYLGFVLGSRCLGRLDQARSLLQYLRYVRRRLFHQLDMRSKAFHMLCAETWRW